MPSLSPLPLFSSPIFPSGAPLAVSTLKRKCSQVVRAKKQIDRVALVKNIVAKLDEGAEWYELDVLAPLLGITQHATRRHCRDLWPKTPSNPERRIWRLSLNEAERLVKRVVYAGKKVPVH